MNASPPSAAVNSDSEASASMQSGSDAESALRSSLSYFSEACPPLAEQLDSTCRSIAASAESAVRVGVPIGAIVLGGGYGRGEGGVWRDQSGGAPALYNDLDFFLFSDRADDVRLRAWVKAEENQWSQRLGIHVDFAILPPQAISHAGDSMMLSDLVLGYFPVFGAVSFLEVAAQYVNPGRLPLWEATRLLWNRGSGLYFARCKIEAQDDSDFVERNHQKLALSLGDAMLCLAGEYDQSVVERGRRFADMPAEHIHLSDESQTARLHKLHQRAVDFKMRPREVKADWAEFRSRDRELTALWSAVFLRVETARLGRHFADLNSYTHDRQRLVPETAVLKNLLIAVRDHRRHGTALKPIWDYPRGALMRCLAAIHDGNVGRASELLPPPMAEELPTLESRYTIWWERYQ
jgi:hypothetical protein